jgi:hypothetical protein
MGPKVAQQSVTPVFPRWVRNTASRREAVVHVDGPNLPGFTGAVTCGCGEAAGVLAVVGVPSAQPEMLRCISGQGYLSQSPVASGIPSPNHPSERTSVEIRRRLSRGTRSVAEVEGVTMVAHVPPACGSPKDVCLW